MIQERVRAGLEPAPREGKRLGRLPMASKLPGANPGGSNGPWQAWGAQDRGAVRGERLDGAADFQRALDAPAASDCRVC